MPERPLRPDALGLALQLARHAAQVDSATLSPATRAAVCRCVLDAIASAAAALDQPGVQAAQQAAPVLHGAGGVPLWFTGRTASVGGALLANSAATAALDLDDGYRMARGHPGAAVIPTALALAQALPHATAGDLMAAVVAGYEVGVRLAAARTSYAPSGAWSGFAVAATAGRLLGTHAETLAQALAIAAQTAPALPALAGLAGSDVKEGIPAGAASGWAALQLALAGSSGPTAVLDDARLFNAPAALHGLRSTPLIEGTYFKPFGCCRHIHAPLQALLQLQAQHSFDASDVDGIEVYTYQATFSLSNRPRPDSLVEAQYSVPYCMALCLLHGADALVPLRAAHLADAQVGRLAQRTVVRHDATIEPLFPARSPARVAVALADGSRLESSLTDPRGDPDRPLSTAELERKLRVATRATLPPARQQALIDAVARLHAGDVRPLLAALKARAGAP
ncbi:MmgE/PrpD family protein [Acidovorax sp. D2M1]|uniref:MmgE/PrpD family protein n=1 Tax=Acidovorax benzenivorans TaxID=2987520 RepID=A0ABT5S254_9BURK|nr:MmgE/PrpD family protein [Acidovorax benzenivorans]MDD2179213.1 MmgE/PrpD family protein [Acidovorax benzenivorans]